MSKLCQLVSFTALDCPGCMRLLEQPCGDGWGLGLEGVPDGVKVALFADKRKIADLQPGKPRGRGKPFAPKTGKRSLEVIFSPSGKHEYFLDFEGRKSMKSDAVFPVRLTIFREEGKRPPTKKAPTSVKRAKRAKKRR